MRKILAIAFVALFAAMPCALLAEDVEIQLVEVIGMNVLPGDNFLALIPPPNFSVTGCCIFNPAKCYTMPKEFA